MAKTEGLARYLTVEGICERKIDYLVEHAPPVLCTELLMRNIASFVQDLNEARPDETKEQAQKRYWLARQYSKVLDFMMKNMQEEIIPALERLEKLQYPGEADEI